MASEKTIFISGGSGEIGRPAIRCLVSSGWRPRVAVRSERGAEIVERLGASPVWVDLFDAAALRSAVAGADAVAHLATKIPPVAEMGELDRWEENDRLRAETTAHLAAAAAAAGARLVLQSYFGVAAPRGAEWIEEPPDREPAWSGIGVMESMREAELAALEVGGVVLRFGSLYSATSEQLQAQVAALRDGLAAVPGQGDNYWPYLSSAGAGRAVAASLTVAPGIYDVNDGDPLTQAEFWAMAAAAVGRPEPPHADVAGHPMEPILLGSWRPSNAAFRAASGWSPEQTTRRDWPAAAARFERERPGRRPDPS